jgi:hypothetical protein
MVTPMPGSIRGLLIVLLALSPFTRPASAQSIDSLGVAFTGGIGQVEVGGVYAGVEFHDSRPVPSRISFYYPVANSIDLSTDYWKRGESRPLTVTVRVDGAVDTLGTTPWAYIWTPYRVIFHEETPHYSAVVDYRFASDVPVVAMKLVFRNNTGRDAAFEVETLLATSLRTSHTYASRVPVRSEYTQDGSAFLAHFDAADTDSATLFVANVGASPHPVAVSGDGANFRYAQLLAPGDSLIIVQLIGTSRRHESAEVLARAVDRWEESVMSYEHDIGTYVREKGHFRIPDPELIETDRLARALLRTNRHHLDGHVVPMPCPAQYNFFFTHDLLLTDLGAVAFDPERVRDDLRYVHSLVRGDSLLPHAHYWRDSTFVTEFADADNWNHLWVVLLSAAYLKHSDDEGTVEALFPTLQKSMELMVGNERDGLMYASRPDWWDIGRVSGPRAYLTALTIRAIEAFHFIALELDRQDTVRPAWSQLAQRMRVALVDRLWDDEAGYLLNGVDAETVDRHFYTGSMLAAIFGLLDHEKGDILLETVRRELLDEQVGVRNAMPADFHLLGELYRFQEGEVGGPFLYMNGGVWPQGNAWYALALIEAGRVNEARDALYRYLSIAGISRSPNGHPAFYEYRNADPAASTYGAIDKPTFLWAGGWFLHVLYRLAGLRENPWNLFFSPHLPDGWDTIEYDLALKGRSSRVVWSGAGPAFSRILFDGVESATAVMTGPVSRIELERGAATTPYLARASAVVDHVRRTDGDRTIVAGVRSIPGQDIEVEVMGPAPLQRVMIDGTERPVVIEWTTLSGGGYSTRVRWRSERAEELISIGN